MTRTAWPEEGEVKTIVKSGGAGSDNGCGEHGSRRRRGGRKRERDREIAGRGSGSGGGKRRGARER